MWDRPCYITLAFIVSAGYNIVLNVVVLAIPTVTIRDLHGARAEDPNSDHFALSRHVQIPDRECDENSWLTVVTV